MINGLNPNIEFVLFQAFRLERLQRRIVLCFHEAIASVESGFGSEGASSFHRSTTAAPSKGGRGFRRASITIAIIRIGGIRRHAWFFSWTGGIGEDLRWCSAVIFRDYASYVSLGKYSRRVNFRLKPFEMKSLQMDKRFPCFQRTGSARMGY